jgi:hypothetical protein
MAGSAGSGHVPFYGRERLCKAAAFLHDRSKAIPLAPKKGGSERDMEGTVYSKIVRPSLGLVLAALSLGLLASPPAYAASSHPDFTGVWTWYRVGSGRPTPSWPKDAPFTEAAKNKIAAYHALVDPTGETPGGFCVGIGMPGNMLRSGGYPMEIIQRPEQITVIYESWTEIRRIYITDKPVPAGDLIPTRNGYSAGHWEGDTLVVETTSLEEQVDQEAAHSEQAKVIERYRLGTDPQGAKILTAEMTMTDPVFYTAPVTATKTWAPAPDERMLNYDCTEPDWQDHLEMLRQKAGDKGSGVAK